MSKVVLVTGASSGIGLSTASLLAAKGFKVYGTSRRPSKEASKDFSMIALDVTLQESIGQCIDEIVKKEGRIDILINNAGMGITGPIEDTPIEEMKKVFDTNFFGATAVIQAVLPVMRKNKSGFIINITSIAGYMGLPFRGIYSATKGAFELTMEALRMEVKEFNIRVCNLAPGDIATNIASGRYHTPVFEDSAYKEKYQLNLDLMNSHVDSGMPPERVAQKIYRMLHNKNPRIHYKVGGFMEKFSIVLKRILPDLVYERLLMNHYKL